MDIDTLELHDKYDVIFSNAALHWVKDHQRLWQNLKTILSEKGIVRFNFAADGNCVHFLKIIREAITMDEYKKYFVNFEWPWYMPTIEEYKKIVEPLSFSELKIWGENADRLFPDKESIIGWINQPSIVPFLKCIEESKRDKIRNYVIDRMLQSTSQKDGYYETFRRINVYAKY